MNTKTFYTGELKTGDLIAVNDYKITLGFYLGRGINYSKQFYSFRALNYWIEHPNSGSPRKWYILENEPCRRIMKITSEHFDEETMKEYEKALEAMKKLEIQCYE